MTAASSAAPPKSTVDKSIEWTGITCAVAVAVYFASFLLTGFSMDYEIRHNQMLVWSAVAGGIGVSACYGWLAYNRDIGGIWGVPGSAKAVWALASGAVLWFAAAFTDMARLSTSAVEYGELAPRIPVEWWQWVPLAIVTVSSLLYARRRGMLRWAAVLLPLQVLWWSATLLTAS